MRSQIRNEPPLGKVVTEKGKASIFAFTWPPPPLPTCLKAELGLREVEGASRERSVSLKSCTPFSCTFSFCKPCGGRSPAPQPSAPCRACCRVFSSERVYLVPFFSLTKGAGVPPLFSPLSFRVCPRCCLRRTLPQAFPVQSLPRADGRRGRPMAARRVRAPEFAPLPPGRAAGPGAAGPGAADSGGAIAARLGTRCLCPSGHPARFCGL